MNKKFFWQRNASFKRQSPKDYEMAHFIMERVRILTPQQQSIILRMFNRLESRKMFASCLSTSVTLLLAFSYIGASSSLILGTVQFQGLSYPHAWLEMDGKIYDLATYEDIKHHPVLKDRGLTPILPQLVTDYETASQNICYYPFQFGSMWEMSDMRRMVGKTLEEYINEARSLDILGDVCYILDISKTPDVTAKLKDITKHVIIKDTKYEEI